MSNIICTWSVNTMQYIVSDGGVIAVDWSCTAEANGKIAVHSGKNTFSPDSSALGYIPYEQLTEEMVLQWVFDALKGEKAVIESDRIAKVEKQLSSTIKSGVPWSNEQNLSED